MERAHEKVVLEEAEEVLAEVQIVLRAVVDWK